MLIIFSTSFIVALSGAMMPGPLLAITVAQAARRGFWAGPLLILGHGLLELPILLVLVLGLIRFKNDGIVPAIISIIGGIVLITMGFGILVRSRHRVTMPTAGTVTKGSNPQGIVTGILGSASNPYLFIWWVTIGASYLLWALKLGAWGVVSFFSGHILADLGWYTLVAFVVATGRRVMSDTVYRLVFIVCGVALVGLGGYFIFTGIRYFMG